MIALNDDDAVFNRATGAAHIFQLFRGLFEPGFIHFQAIDDTDTFAAAPLNLSLNADSTVIFEMGGFRYRPFLFFSFPADAAGSRFSARRTHPAGFG